MNKSSFLRCVFQGDSKIYSAEITKALPETLDGRFLHSGKIFKFDMINWKVMESDRTFPAGTIIEFCQIYNPAEGSSLDTGLYAGITFGDNSSYLGQIESIDGNVIDVKLSHSGSPYKLDIQNNTILKSEGKYRAGEMINSFYPCWPQWADIVEPEGEVVVTRPGSLHTPWEEYFSTYTIEMIKGSVPRGNVLLQRIIDSVVFRAKIISHAIKNPIDGQELTEDTLKLLLVAMELNEIEFLKKAAKIVFGSLAGSLYELIRANQAADVSRIRGGLYQAFISGCLEAIYGTNSVTSPYTGIDKAFFDFGFNAIYNLGEEERLSRATTPSEVLRASLIIALVESYRIRTVPQLEYSLYNYTSAMDGRSIGTLRSGFEKALINIHTLNDD